MDFLNIIFVIIPLYCIADGILMLVRGNYTQKQLQRYDRYTDESVKRSVKPNAIIYIVLGVIFSVWNLMDFGVLNAPSFIQIGLMVIILLLIAATAVINKKILVEKTGYIGGNRRML